MKLLEILEKALKTEPNFVSDDGDLKKWVIIHNARNNNPDLLSLLLKAPEAKAHFFIEVNGILIFNQSLFIQFLEQKNYLNDSYTNYRNKIGLNIDGKFLQQQNEVILSWPFKDCVLEGGQSREADDREEIFFNKILAQDEITQLFEPKVLTNGKRYSSVTVKSPGNLKRRADGTISENLIIKGNNLLALHSLKKQYAGKIKLIYIDPPYNTGGLGDTFMYNNNFKRSTWLTFMYNRLQIARDLLSEDGVLIVAIDENEQAHLGVLLKEYFTEHEIHCITIVHNPRGVQGTNFSYTHEYAFFIVPQGKKLIGDRIIEESEIEFSNLRNWGGESLRSDAKNCFYPIVIDPKTAEILSFGDVSPDNFNPKKREVQVKDHIHVYPLDNDHVERKWRYARQSVEQVKHLLRARKKNGQWDIEIGKDFGQYKTVWVDPKYDANEYGTKIVNKLVSGNTFSFPKSLYNVKDCIYAVVGTDKDAIILDYHAGSGTTAHAVLEINKEDGGNRKFILCEQMDYIESVTNIRVQKAIETINSKEDFVYLELKKFNQKFVDQIKSAKETATLLEIWLAIKNRSFIDYSIDLKAFEANIDEFKKLKLKEQKQIFIDILDQNQLYVNLSSMLDADSSCSAEEQKITKDFYNLDK